MKPSVVVLAAGASQRLGQCKALADLGGRSVLERLLSAALEADAADILVVSGAHAPEIARELERIEAGPRVSMHFHADWALGRGGSLAAAAAYLPERDLLVAPVDVPLVPAAVFRRLLEEWAFAGAPERGWLAPFLGPGRRFGHPVILGRGLARGLGSRPATAPLKLTRATADPVWGVEVFDPGILDDLDSPADLQRLRGRLAAH